MTRNRTTVIGIVGGVGSGKSAVAAELAGLLDAVLIDGDRVGHETLQDRDVAAAVRDAFPPAAGDDGSIDRHALGRIVFADPAAMDRLEAILHPRMRRRFESLMTAAKAAGRPTVFDAAVLLESGWDDLCDAIVFVDVPETERRRRAVGRGWTEDRWRNAEASQWPLDRKRAAAHAVVANITTPAEAAAAACPVLNVTAAED